MKWLLRLLYIGVVTDVVASYARTASGFFGDNPVVIIAAIAIGMISTPILLSVIGAEWPQ